MSLRSIRTVLGVETSCDETAAAVVDDGWRVRGSVIASQHELHETYRGVVPEIASRAHLRMLTPTLNQTLDQAGVTIREIDAVAVGSRPGLIGSLLVGVSAAKALAWAIDRPLIGVDHVHAHLYAPHLAPPPAGDLAHEPALATRPEIQYPALGLVVSGGHTSLYLLRSPLERELLGRTIDDAVGEAYDKAAVILGLPYPGGPHLDQAANRAAERRCRPAVEASPSVSPEPPPPPKPPESPESPVPPAPTPTPDAPNPERVRLPRSLLDRDSLDFSFSGLKTALLYAVRGRPRGRGRDASFTRSAEDWSPAQRDAFAAAFQEAAIDTLILKLDRAVERLAGEGVELRSLLVGGGVSANSLLRRRACDLARRRSMTVHLPAMDYCLDNAAMIAGLGHAIASAGLVDDLSLPAVATTSG